MTLAAGANKITFKSFGVDLVGDLYLPEGFDESKTYKAIVGASPFPQVKDQIPATYGPEMAARGFIYLGFDYLGMGDSPALAGEFKQSRYMLEDTGRRVYRSVEMGGCGHHVGTKSRRPGRGERQQVRWARM